MSFYQANSFFLASAIHSIVRIRPLIAGTAIAVGLANVGCDGPLSPVVVKKNKSNSEQTAANNANSDSLPTTSPLTPRSYANMDQFGRPIAAPSNPPTSVPTTPASPAPSQLGGHTPTPVLAPGLAPTPNGFNVSGGTAGQGPGMISSQSLNAGGPPVSTEPVPAATPAPASSTGNGKNYAIEHDEVQFHDGIASETRVEGRAQMQFRVEYEFTNGPFSDCNYIFVVTSRDGVSSEFQLAKVSQSGNLSAEILGWSQAAGPFSCRLYEESGGRRRTISKRFMLQSLE